MTTKNKKISHWFDSKVEVNEASHPYLKINRRMSISIERELTIGVVVVSRWIEWHLARVVNGWRWISRVCQGESAVFSRRGHIQGHGGIEFRCFIGIAKSTISIRTENDEFLPMIWSVGRKYARTTRLVLILLITKTFFQTSETFLNERLTRARIEGRVLLVSCSNRSSTSRSLLDRSTLVDRHDEIVRLVVLWSRRFWRSSFIFAPRRLTCWASVNCCSSSPRFRCEDFNSTSLPFNWDRNSSNFRLMELFSSPRDF